MENYVARDSQWEFINDIYATESWLDLKCMPINLADWKGMTTIKNQVNIYALIVYNQSSGQYLCIDCLLYD